MQSHWTISRFHYVEVPTKIFYHTPYSIVNVVHTTLLSPFPTTWYGPLYCLHFQPQAVHTHGLAKLALSYEGDSFSLGDCPLCVKSLVLRDAPQPTL